MALTKIGTDGVKDDAITSGKIPANAVGSSELADNAVDTNAIQDGAVSNNKLQDNSIVSGKLADSGVNSGSYGSATAIPAITVNNKGQITAASTNNVSIPPGTTINNNADNRIITGSGSANTLNGESDLTFDGNTLTHTVGDNLHRITSIAAGDHYTLLEFDSNRTTAGNALSFINFKWDGDKVCDIYAETGDDTTNKDNGHLVFRTSNSQGSIAERMRIKASGEINIGGVASPQYPKTVNIQGGNDATLSLSNQNYTGHAAGSQSGIEGRVQCGNNIWSTAGIRFKKKNGTAGDKHTELELYATDGYQNQTGFSMQPDGEVNLPKQPMALIYSNSGDPGASNNKINNAFARFTGVHLNVGNCYSTSTGKFTCPVDGVYGVAFTSNLNVSSLSVGQNFNIQTRRNQSIHMYNYNTTFTQGWQQMTFTNYINCNANDELQFYFSGSAAFGADQGSGVWGQMYFWLQQ